jgi:hypothetical protein
METSRQGGQRRSIAPSMPAAMRAAWNAASASPAAASRSSAAAEAAGSA